MGSTRPSGSSSTESEVKKYGLAITLDANIEAVSQLAVNLAALGDEGFTPLRLLDQVEHRAGAVVLIVEIQTGLQVNIDAPGKQRHVDMRRHRHPGSVAHHTGFDCVQGPLTGIERGGGAAKAVEGFFQVEIGVVAALVVGLPELQKGVAHQMAVAVVDI